LIKKKIGIEFSNHNSFKGAFLIGDELKPLFHFNFQLFNESYVSFGKWYWRNLDSSNSNDNNNDKTKANKDYHYYQLILNDRQIILNIFSNRDGDSNVKTDDNSIQLYFGNKIQKDTNLSFWAKYKTTIFLASFLILNFGVRTFFQSPNSKKNKINN